MSWKVLIFYRQIPFVVVGVDISLEATNNMTSRIITRYHDINASS